MGVRISPPVRLSVNQPAMDKVITFLKDSVEEIRAKVTWPTYEELQKSSTLVLVASFIFAIVVGLVDFVFQNGMTWFYGSF